MSRSRVWLAASAVLLALGAVASAQEYPNAPIRLVNPFLAGGALDVVARLIQPVMQERLGQPIVIDNRPGSGGFVGAGQVAHAPPDGYTLLITTSGPVVNSFQSPLPYDVKKDFQPISKIMTAPLLLVVGESSPIKSVADLIARGKDPKERISYGHPGVGTATHFAGALFTLMASAPFVDVPYRGAAGQVQDTISGQVQFGFLSAPDALSRLGQGLRALGVASLERSPLVPDVPTISEAGLAGFEFELWFGLFAPANTPRPIVDKIRSALEAALADERIRSRFLALGMIPEPNTPEEFAAQVRRQMEKDIELVRKLNIKGP